MLQTSHVVGTPSLYEPSTQMTTGGIATDGFNGFNNGHHGMSVGHSSGATAPGGTEAPPGSYTPGNQTTSGFPLYSYYGNAHYTAGS